MMLKVSELGLNFLKGTVKRITEISIDGSSSFRVLLDNCDVIFAVDPLLVPEITVTSVGDNVSISYYDTQDAVAAVDKFDNLDIDVRVRVSKNVGGENETLSVNFKKKKINK